MQKLILSNNAGILQNKVEESGNRPHCRPESSYEGANGSKEEQILPY